MPVTQPTIIDHLDREWDELVRRGIADEALARWRRRRPTLDFVTVGDLVAALADRDRDPEYHNHILCALLELAPSDQLAARFVLHRFVPYLKRFVADHEPFDAEEWVALLVASAYEAICSHPAEAGPSHATANLTRETRRRALAALADRRRGDRELTEAPGVLAAEPSATHHDPFTSVDLRDFLTWAVRRRRASSGGRAGVGGLRWTSTLRHPTDPPSSSGARATPSSSSGFTAEASLDTPPRSSSPSTRPAASWTHSMRLTRSIRAVSVARLAGSCRPSVTIGISPRSWLSGVRARRGSPVGNASSSNATTPTSLHIGGRLAHEPGTRPSPAPSTTPSSRPQSSASRLRCRVSADGQSRWRVHSWSRGPSTFGARNRRHRSTRPCGLTSKPNLIPS